MGKVDPVIEEMVQDLCARAHEEEQYGRIYLVIRFAASTIERVPMPK